MAGNVIGFYKCYLFLNVYTIYKYYLYSIFIKLYEINYL